jgi:hypothetical protein
MQQSIQGESITPNNYKFQKMARSLQIGGGHTQPGDKPSLNDLQERIFAQSKSKLEMEKTIQSSKSTKLFSNRKLSGEKYTRAIKPLYKDRSAGKNSNSKL